LGGVRYRIDATAKDAGGVPTYSPTAPTWVFTAQATVDGVTSNLLTITFQ